MPAEKQATTDATPKPYAPPKVYQGEVVLWSMNGSSDKLDAFVTSVTGNTINVTVIADGQIGQRAYRGVRHKSDPMLRQMLEAPGGTWEHTEFGRKVHELID